MEVVDGLAAVSAGVGYDPIAVGEIAVAEGGGGFEQVAEDFGGGCGGVGEVLFGNEEQVRGSLGVDVGEGEAEVVFVDGLDGDGAVDNLAEDAVVHGAMVTRQVVGWEWPLWGLSRGLGGSFRG